MSGGVALLTWDGGGDERKIDAILFKGGGGGGICFFNPFVQTAPFTGREHEGGNACESDNGRERVKRVADIMCLVFG